ncbi:hypothetical protein EWF20_00305 [Sulfolobus sp. S-194]|uniref:hypothetical protein n=1 Tax=Sulfolobus sp. S-194 TaxID=2512240 RepID=UPI001437200F|nr:hypothetical protein [Sulfolobus sp. S-194]QIW22755.1 hypothetical protein EWF20_00305 [Sulfolobus sp. S-194]
MRKIYFAIPIVILIAGLIPLLITHVKESSSGIIYVIGNVKIGYSTIPIEQKLDINATEYINLTVKNSGDEAIAICYIKQGDVTIPGYNITAIVNGITDYGSSIPPGISNLTLLISGYKIEENITAYVYLGNGQLLELNFS